MTALAGFWSSKERSSSLEQCRRILDAQAEYGADIVSAATVNERLALGRGLFRLLPEDCYDRQPIVGRGGKLVLVADVRLDNRAELAGLLGIMASSAAELADSALVLRAWERWGSDCLHRIVGDYAIGCYDDDAGTLTLARDPLGQRPLFWRAGPDFIAFASMPKGLHALRGLDRRPDLETVARHVVLLPRAGEASFFASIQRVEPGHMVTIGQDGRVVRRRHWHPERRDLGLRTFEEHVEGFRAHLDEAVKARLRGCDGEIATHLSGGWDSSAVTATAARLLGNRRVLAFTSVPNRRREVHAPKSRFTDEGPLAAAVAGLYGNVVHELVEDEERSVLSYLEQATPCFERPPFNPCNHVWLAQIRERVRARGARILLTGEVGNWNISAAPNSLLADFVRERDWGAWWREAAGMLRDGRARVRGVAANSFGAWLPSSAWRAAQRFSSAPRSDLGTALNPTLMGIYGRQRAELVFEATRRHTFHQTAVSTYFSLDFGEYRKGILGRWGVDKRDATADRRLIEFCLSLPLDMLMKDGVRRPLARAALSDRLPPVLLNEKRKGHQAAGWHHSLENDRPAILDFLSRLEQNPDASAMLDAGAMRTWVQHWPQGGWTDADVIARYRTALLTGLAAGAFLLQASS